MLTRLADVGLIQSVIVTCETNVQGFIIRFRIFPILQFQRPPGMVPRTGYRRLQIQMEVSVFFFIISKGNLYASNKFL